MNLFIDENGKVFCEFTEGIYSPISDDYLRMLVRTKSIETIEFVLVSSD